MVKNTTGGSRHKNMARKSLGGGRGRLRTAEEGEIYAIVTKILGGPNCSVLGCDDKERLCVIRGKFRGRNKRDNTIKVNTFVIAGLRSVSMGEVVASNKKEKADLIYVYNENDFDELKEIPAVMGIISDEKRNEMKEDVPFEFSHSTKDDEEEEVIESDKSKENFKIGDVEISFDDI